MEVLVVYLCDKKACGDQCPDFIGLCNHTLNKKHAIHKNHLTDTLFRPILSGGSGEIMGFEEIESDCLKQKIIDIYRNHKFSDFEVLEEIAKLVGISVKNEESEEKQ